VREGDTRDAIPSSRHKRPCTIPQRDSEQNPKFKIPNPKQIQISQIQNEETGRCEAFRGTGTTGHPSFRSLGFRILVLVWNLVLGIRDFRKRIVAELSMAV
jgi:hypothetical protein